MGTGFTSTVPIFTTKNILKGGWQDWFTLAVFFFGIIPLTYKLFKNPNRTSSEYFGNLAWLRAFIFFGWCIVISYFTGVFDVTFAQGPYALSLYSPSHLWLWLTPLNFAVIIVGYWIIWPIGTVIYGRGKFGVLGFQILFGIVNGVCESMLNLSVWAVSELIPAPRWGTFLIFFFVQGGWKSNWDQRYWNVYVTPEHNILSCNVPKIFSVHVPNILISFTHLILFAQPLIFICTQTIALIGTNIFTCILPPWDTTWKNPPDERLIQRYADKAKAENWNGVEWIEDSLDASLVEPKM